MHTEKYIRVKLHIDEFSQSEQTEVTITQVKKTKHTPASQDPPPAPSVSILSLCLKTKTNTTDSFHYTVWILLCLASFVQYYTCVCSFSLLYSIPLYK